MIKALLLSSLIAIQVAFAGDYALELGGKLITVREAEGDGLTAILFRKDLGIEFSFNRASLSLQPLGGGAVQYNEYLFYRLGVRYILNHYDDDRIKLFLTMGLETILNDTPLSTQKDLIFNSYGVFGLDFAVDTQKHWHINFGIGSSGKGAQANNFLGAVDFAHGMNTLLEFMYRF